MSHLEECNIGQIAKLLEVLIEMGIVSKDHQLVTLLHGIQSYPCLNDRHRTDHAPAIESWGIKWCHDWDQLSVELFSGIR